MPGRSFSSVSYRYGFNGKESDDEVSGSGNQYDYGFRIYNPRIGKFLSVDPLTGSYPWYTPYQFAGNMPIWAMDLDGLEEAIRTNAGTLGDGTPQVAIDNTATIFNLSTLSSETINELFSLPIKSRDYALEYMYRGTKDVKKLRDANNFDRWLLKNVDPDELYNILKALGHPATSGESPNMLRPNWEMEDFSEIIQESITDEGFKLTQGVLQKEGNGKYSYWYRSTLTGKPLEFNKAQYVVDEDNEFFNEMIDETKIVEDAKEFFEYQNLLKELFEQMPKEQSKILIE
jgi:RHS repeat-associated protein